MGVNFPSYLVRPRVVKLPIKPCASRTCAEVHRGNTNGESIAVNIFGAPNQEDLANLRKASEGQHMNAGRLILKHNINTKQPGAGDLNADDFSKGLQKCPSMVPMEQDPTIDRRMFITLPNTLGNVLRILQILPWMSISPSLSQAMGVPNRPRTRAEVLGDTKQQTCDGEGTENLNPGESNGT